MEALKPKQFTDYFKKRPRHAHKGDFGHVLIVGGDHGYSGAVMLAAEAALRVGAGLVSVVSRVEKNVIHPEIMCHTHLKNVLDKATVIVLGPGLGQSAWGHELFSTVIDTKKSLIVDADGLNFLAEKPFKKTNWILTPHPGEAGRLLKTTSAEIQSDRVTALKKLREQYDGIIVLKGANSLIMTPSSVPVVCEAGNPGMASGGMGDVLSGVIAGLAAQQMPLDVAAKAGVLVHAMAGDLAAKKGERGMIASDLMPYLREIVN